MRPCIQLQNFQDRKPYNIFVCNLKNRWLLQSIYNTLNTYLLTNLNKFCTFLDWSEVSSITYQCWSPAFTSLFSALLWFCVVINRELSTFGLLFCPFCRLHRYVRKYHKIYNIYLVTYHIVFIFSTSKGPCWIYKTVKI